MLLECKAPPNKEPVVEGAFDRQCGADMTPLAPCTVLPSPGRLEQAGSFHHSGCGRRQPAEPGPGVGRHLLPGKPCIKHLLQPMGCEAQGRSAFQRTGALRRHIVFAE